MSSSICATWANASLHDCPFSSVVISSVMLSALINHHTSFSMPPIDMNVNPIPFFIVLRSFASVTFPY